MGPRSDRLNCAPTGCCRRGLPGGEKIFALTSLVVLASIILHGVSAAPLAGWYARRGEERTLLEELVSRLQPGIEGGGLPGALSELLERGAVPLLFYRGH